MVKTFDDVVEFHGHACPGLALGYRVAARTLKEMGERAGDEELVAVVENDSCAVDAIQVVAGCTFGKGNLMFRDYGKQVYTFIKRPSGESIRLSVKWEPPPETGEERAAWEKYSGGDRSEGVASVVHSRKSRKIRSIMEAGDEEIFTVVRGQAAPPPEARIYPSVRCGRCGEKVMEARARVRGGQAVCLPCFEMGETTEAI